MTSIITELANLDDEPIVSHADEKILQDIISITRTSEFELMGLEDEKLDSLVSCLREQEDFAVEITNITKGLEMVPSILLPDEDDEEEYI